MSDRHTMAKDRSGYANYLGDGVCVVHDGYGVWLTAEDGTVATDAIYLEPSVFKALERFIIQCNKQKGKEGGKNATRI